MRRRAWKEGGNLCMYVAGLVRCKGQNKSEKKQAQEEKFFSFSYDTPLGKRAVVNVSHFSCVSISCFLHPGMFPTLSSTILAIFLSKNPSRPLFSLFTRLFPASSFFPILESIQRKHWAAKRSAITSNVLLRVRINCQKDSRTGEESRKNYEELRIKKNDGRKRRDTKQEIKRR